MANPIIVNYPKKNKRVPAFFFVAQGVYIHPQRIVAKLESVTNPSLVYTGTPMGLDFQKYWRRSFSDVSPGKYLFKAYDIDFPNISVEFPVPVMAPFLPPAAPPFISFPRNNSPTSAFVLGPTKQFTAFGITNSAGGLLENFSKCSLGIEYTKVAPTYSPALGAGPPPYNWQINYTGLPCDPANRHAVRARDANGSDDQNSVYFRMPGGGPPAPM